MKRDDGMILDKINYIPKKFYGKVIFVGENMLSALLNLQLYLLFTKIGSLHYM